MPASSARLRRYIRPWACCALVSAISTSKRWRAPPLVSMESVSRSKRCSLICAEDGTATANAAQAATARIRIKAECSRFFMADAYPSGRHAGKCDRERGGCRAPGRPDGSARLRYTRHAGPLIRTFERCRNNRRPTLVNCANNFKKQTVASMLLSIPLSRPWIYPLDRDGGVRPVVCVSHRLTAFPGGRIWARGRFAGAHCHTRYLIGGSRI